MHKNLSILKIACIGIFCGLMIAILGGLAYPPVIETVGAPFLISGMDRLTMGKYDYSYKPGQSGTQFIFYRVSTNGKKTDITLPLMAYATLVYSIICSVLLFVVGTALDKAVSAAERPTGKE